jgi:hypothetical protein
VRVPRGGWGPLNLRLDPSAGVKVENMSVIKVHITLLLSSIVVTLNIQYVKQVTVTPK